MFKTEVKDNSGPRRRTFAAMKPGEIGRIVGGGYDGEVVLRGFSQVVSLMTPGSSWTDVYTLAHIVELLPPGSVITITVQESN